MSQFLTDYLNVIGRHPVLTQEAQLRHCQRIRRWYDWPEGKDKAPENVIRLGRRSMDAMCRTNMRLVVSIAMKYQNRGVDIHDLIQEGNIGLIRGLELFDPTRGYTVGTYAYWWIKQAMTRAIHMHARTIRIPINTHDLIGKIQRFSSHHFCATGRQPTLPELAEHLDLTPTRVLDLLQVNALTTCCSLDVVCQPDSAGSCTMGELLPAPTPSPDDLLENEADHARLKEALTQIPLLEAKVVEETYLNRRTLKSLAPELGCNRAKVAAIQRRGIAQLRKVLQG